MEIASFMSQVNYYEDVKVIKKPLKQRIKSILKIFLVIATIVGCFFVAGRFSSALTVGNLGSLIVYGDTMVKVGGDSLFAVTIGSYDSYDQAEKVALGSTIQGASGFVWEQDNKYFVIGNIYSSVEDANKVIDNISGTNYVADILEIKFPKLKLNFDSYDNSDMPIVNSAIALFDKIYDALYMYSVKFDKGEISHLAVSGNISGIRGELKGVMVGVQNLINKQSTSLVVVQEYLVGVDEVLDQAILKTIDNSATNYSLKNAIATVVRLKYDMYQKLK
jgi:hypothetical protein